MQGRIVLTFATAIVGIISYALYLGNLEGLSQGLAVIGALFLLISLISFYWIKSGFYFLRILLAIGGAVMIGIGLTIS
jgi:uncharacterized membrane protein